MRIAQVAPLHESVPPKHYGGTERVVSYLTEELVREGHEVTLFASGDSVTTARLVAACRRALRLDKDCVDPLAHHILPQDLYRYRPEPGKYFAFLGRISPEKRVDRAIEIAKQTGIPLKIAAKVDPVDQDYFETVVEPLLHEPLVEYVSEIGEGEKDEFLGNAYALLFPIDWPEPFGLAMIEAMA